MNLKTTINKQDFFNKLIKSKCRFKKIAGLYPAKCKNIKYVGQLKNFKEMEVYQLSEEEADLLKKCFLLFQDSEIKIIKD